MNNDLISLQRCERQMILFILFLWQYATFGAFGLLHRDSQNCYKVLKALFSFIRNGKWLFSSSFTFLKTYKGKHNAGKVKHRTTHQVLKSSSYYKE